MGLHMRVLVVDDEENVLNALRMVFEECGFTVETARSVPGATARIQSAAPDAVVVDKNLPGDSGIELVRYLRENHAEVAVVVITAYATPGSAKESLNLGADAYLEKPFPNVYSVVGSVREALKKRGKTAAAAAASAPRAPERVLVMASPDGHLRLASTLTWPHEVLAAPADLSKALAMNGSALVLIDSTAFPPQEVVALALQIRRHSTDTPIVVATGSALGVAVIRSFVDAGVTAVVDSGAELREKLASLMPPPRA